MAHILLIDDNEMVRETVNDMLASAGHGVEEASDGLAGLEKFAPGKYDVVISDIFMPGEDGIGTIRKIRREDSVVGIIAISGGGGGDSAEDVLRITVKLGADCTLAKPFSRAQLLAAVASASDKHHK
ncbi:MAG TPA: response regulator [Stellaceae bacterium]|nr:response regulator [Stellaceae bacterium]